MSMLHSWTALLDEETKARFAQSRLWGSSVQQLEWEAALIKPSWINTLRKSLTAAELSVLDCLLRGLLLQPQLDEVLIGELSSELGRPKRECRVALNTLAQAGMISSIQHSWHGIYYFMPLPIFTAWRKVLVNQQADIDDCSLQLDSDMVYAVHEQSTQWIEDGQLTQHKSIYSNELPAQFSEHCRYGHAVKFPITLLLFVHELSLHSLTYTKQGDISKKLKRLLNNQLEKYCDAEAISQLWQHWLYYEKEDRVDHSFAAVSLLLELAHDFGLLEKLEHAYSINYAKLTQWLQLPQQSQEELIWHWLLQRLLSGLMNKHTGAASIQAIGCYAVDIMNGQGNWTDFALEHYIPASSKSAGRQIRLQLQLELEQQLQQLLELLSRCGFVSYALANSQDIYDELEREPASTTASGDHDYREFSSSFYLYTKRELSAARYDNVHLEPNGEMYILPGTLPVLIWQALEASEIVVVQEIIQLRMTMQSLQRCIASGHKIEELVHWLTAICSEDEGLPDLVAAMLKQIANAEENEKLLRQAYIPLHIEVSTGEYNDYTPLSIKSWGTYSANPLGKLMEGVAISPYGLSEQKLAEVLARSWWKELRRYHSSTMVQIIEAALQYGLALYIQLSSKLWHIVPISMNEKEGKRMLTAAAYAKPQLPLLDIELDSIEAIQLAVDE